MSLLQLELNVIPNGEDAKARGAFYTDAQIADFLVWWAVRSAQDTVMDPSFGGGVFLRSTCKRLLKLGGRPAAQIFGIEVDPNVHIRIAEKLSDEFAVRKQNLLLSDFFDIEAGNFRQIDAVVGNPPFIRYQRFSGDLRKRALKCAAKQGVKLSALSSSWAPFLVHSVAMLKEGGRLAMVIPMEIGYAVYAQPVLEHLSKSFSEVTFLTFRKKLFPDLSEDILLLLAENKGSHTAKFLCRDLAHAGVLAKIRNQEEWLLSGTRRVNTLAIARKEEKLVEYLIPSKARELYRELKGLALTKRLGEIADVGIGYVTGSNNFFHLNRQQARSWNIPEAFLRPAVRRGRALSGLQFSPEDWRNAVAIGEAGYLLFIAAGAELTDSVRQYLRYGENQGVSKTYKCRTREPWFCVPHVYRPDAFLTYMSGTTPRLVANNAGAVAPNSLHVVRLYSRTDLTSNALATLWQTSLTRLSAEIEGHALGGGMLKLEPTEAENVVLPLINHASDGTWSELARELDALIRNGNNATAQSRADAVILKEVMGLNKSDCDILRAAAETLRNRRYGRSFKE